jgi:hypothetical protein
MLLCEVLAIANLCEVTLTALARRLGLSWEEARSVMTRAVLKVLAYRRPAVMPHLWLEYQPHLNCYQ